MADELKGVIEDLNKSFADFKQKNDERIKEIEEKGSADPLLTKQVDEINAKLSELEDVKANLEKVETAMARKQYSAKGVDGEDLDQKAMDFARMCAKSRGDQIPESYSAEDLAQYKAGFRQMMRKGDLVSLDVQKALSAGSDPDGGYTVDPDTGGRIVTKIFETSPMRQFASVQTIGTDALEGLFDLDEAGAGWVNETGSRSATDTPELGAWRIPVHEIYANPAATQRLLDDSSVNIEQWLANKVSDKFMRTENTAFVTGDGIGKPRGFLTYANGTTLPGTIEQVGSGANGAFPSDGTDADPLADIVYALKQGYRSGARFFTTREVVSEIRQLKTADGAYVWQPGIGAGQPSTLYGYPIAELEDMPALATGSLSLAFGNMSEAYQIVDRAGIRVLRDPYTNKPYVHFYTVKRVGGDVVNFEALKIMDFSA